ncbi:hypothetical protein D9758_012854 [Tetrapyrgos nigripes]|uniref:Uncharacterized protein n=1 Tax=Tetrapyrgos nigripes TaxID=182062 RepID=A0A8H5CB49_9AGAR|nr:hypothetical protein D9758_012854 [Tetrapyrgos nigripes]
MLFFSSFILASVFGASIAAPTPVKRELVGQVLPDVATFGGIPGTARVADLSQNECGIKVNPGDFVFLLSRAGSAPGSTAAENGLCGRSDATVFVLDENNVILAENGPAFAPVGFCDDCADGDVVLSQAAFDELGGNPATGTFDRVFVRFG